MKLTKHKPNIELLKNLKLIQETLLECMKINDDASFEDLRKAYLRYGDLTESERLLWEDKEALKHALQDADNVIFKLTKEDVQVFENSLKNPKKIKWLLKKLTK